MDRSSASSPSQGGNTQRSTTSRVRKIPSTPRPKEMTPPTPQAMVLPAISATQPPETSGSESYLRIIKDIMGKFSPTGKMRDLLTHMAEEIRKEEANPSPIPLKTPTDPTLPAETPAVHPLEDSTPMSTTFPMANPTKHTRDQEDDTEAMRDTGNNSRVEGELSGEGEELKKVKMRKSRETLS